MIGRNGGRRVFVKSTEPVPEFFARLDVIFEDMRKQPAKLKYYAAEQIPGMEVVFEDQRYAAVSVWKKGTDLRVLATDEPRVKAIEREVDQQNEREVAELNASGEDSSNTYSKYYKIKEARRFEASGWFAVANGAIGSAVAQPAEAEYIPSPDTLVPAPVCSLPSTAAGVGRPSALFAGVGPANEGVEITSESRARTAAR